MPNFKYFLLIIVAPIIGIITIFSYAYIYVQNEISILEHEVTGLNRVNQVQSFVFDLQKLRGLSNISTNNPTVVIDIKKLKDTIYQKTSILKNELNSIPQTSKVKKHLQRYIQTVEEHIEHVSDFNRLSLLIQDSIILIEHIAYHSRLILDNQLKSYVLIDMIVSTLPELIEYNGQIRGISSSVKDYLPKEKRYKILTQLSKINDRINKLKFNMSQLDTQYDDIIYKDIFYAQQSLIDFTRHEVLQKDKILIRPIDLFELNSNNITLITLFYKKISHELKEILEIRVQEKQNIALLILLLGFSSIIFIIFINIAFFNKNKKFIEKIKLLSITDSMTGLYNRRYFDSEFDKQLKIKARLQQNLIFIMLDIDHFKQYNDTYGHQAGDKTLISIAESLKNDLKRPDDMIFRLGGEEFGILFSDVDKIKAVDFANRLRIHIEELNIKHSHNSASEFVTASMGVSIIQATCELKMNVIYKKTDDALYKAKENGRNQICMSELFN